MSNTRKLPGDTALADLLKDHNSRQIAGMYNCSVQAVNERRVKLRKLGLIEPAAPKPRIEPPRQRKLKPIGCPTCTANPYARGLCHNCYERAWRRGMLDQFTYPIQVEELMPVAEVEVKEIPAKRPVAKIAARFQRTNIQLRKINTELRAGIQQMMSDSSQARLEVETMLIYESKRRAWVAWEERRARQRRRANRAGKL